MIGQESEESHLGTTVALTKWVNCIEGCEEMSRLVGKFVTG